MSSVNFWNDKKHSEEVINLLNNEKKVLEDVQNLLEETNDYLEMAKSLDSRDEESLLWLETESKNLSKKIDETETIILQDDMPYLRISQENEEDENEYTYSYYRNGRIIKEVTQSLEFDDGKREMSISIEENNEETEISFTYHNEYIEVEYEIENNEEEFELEDLIIYIFDDHYIYHLDGFTDVKINKF